MLVTLVPHTTSVQGTRFEVSVQAKFLQSNGVFDAQQVVTVPHVKLVRKLGDLPADEDEEMVSALERHLEQSKEKVS